MTELLGVDVASFQGLPAQWRAAAGHISYVAVKLTELEPPSAAYPNGNHYVNPDAKADWAYAKSRGYGRIAYLYGHPATSPAETVDLFCSVLVQLGLEDGDGIMLDHEWTDGLSPAKVSAWAVDVMGRLAKRLARTPLLYTYLNFAETANCTGLGGYPLAISDPSSPPGHPRIPPPWRRWAIHQYATGGAIDRDIANFTDLAAMRFASW